MVDKVIITQIKNGLLLEEKWITDAEHSTYCKDWVDVIAQLDAVYGNVDRTLRKWYEEQTKKQVRDQAVQTAKEKQG